MTRQKPTNFRVHTVMTLATDPGYHWNLAEQSPVVTRSRGDKTCLGAPITI